MSLLIKGMDMQKSCKDCDIKRNILGWYSCALGAKDGKPLNLENIYDELIYIDSRHPDCPLVKIPTTHGRLIDADEVKENGNRYTICISGRYHTSWEKDCDDEVYHTFINFDYRGSDIGYGGYGGWFEFTDYEDLKNQIDKHLKQFPDYKPSGQLCLF